MNNLRYLEILCGQPWHFSPGHWECWLARAGQSLAAGPKPPAVAALDRRPKVNASGDPVPQMSFRHDGQTAVIPVSGAMYQGATPSDKYYGGLISYADIDEDIDAAVDAGCSNVLFNFDTPGGSVVGGGELANRIAALAGQGINTVAFTGSVMASMGMYLAAGCQSVLVTPTSISGSIGTICQMIDVSAFLEKLGIKANIFTSGQYKGMGNPLQPMTDAQRTWMQGSTDDWANQFKSHVTANRTTVQPETMQGQWFSGTAAVKVGLADATVSGLQEALDLLA